MKLSNLDVSFNSSSYLHKALANLARATLESVVQERWVSVRFLSRTCMLVFHHQRLNWITWNLSLDLDPDQHASSACCWGSITWSKSRWRISPWFQPKRLKICSTRCCRRTWSSYRYVLGIWWCSCDSSFCIYAFLLSYHPKTSNWTKSLQNASPSFVFLRKKKFNM